jgi:hypothetical protein
MNSVPLTESIPEYGLLYRREDGTLISVSPIDDQRARDPESERRLTMPPVIKPCECGCGEAP